MSAKNEEHIPWYRAKNYDGNLTEAEKRTLDQFRMMERHPAARFEDLPEEVGSYIIGLELSYYDELQDSAALTAMFFSVIALALIYSGFMGYGYYPIWEIIFGLIALAMSWIKYKRQWRQNADNHMSSKHLKGSMTDEKIKREWEIEFITKSKSKAPADWD